MACKTPGFRWQRWRATRLMAVTAILALAGCAVRRRPTRMLPTGTAQRAGATVHIAPTATPRLATPTRELSTSTATPRAPTATSVPLRPTLTPSAPPLEPTDTPSPVAQEPAIHTFRANVELADPGDTITLTWRWSGGDEATLYHLLPTGQLGTALGEVGPTGSLGYTISPERRNTDTFALFVHDKEGLTVQDTVQVALRCPDAWFFTPAPDICPAGPAVITNGAEERFERGTMVWVGAEDRIYILFDDEKYPRWSAHTDEWHEGEPTMDPAIDLPPDLQQPVRGFGLVWREEPGVRERLGWAVEEERAYKTAVQRTSHVRYPTRYLRALDGGVWELGPNGSAWEHIAAVTEG